jgi:hypothetical protein
MRIILKRGALVAVLLALAGLVASCGTEETKFSATVSAIDGTVEMQGTDGNWNPVTAGQKVIASDSVRTAKGAKATILIEDGSKIFLDEETTLALKELAKPRSASTFDVVLELVKGAIFSDVTKRDGTKFEVETSVSVAGVKGTRFIVDMRGMESASLPGKPFEKGGLWHELIDRAYADGPGSGGPGMGGPGPGGPRPGPMDPGPGPGSGLGRPDDNPGGPGGRSDDARGRRGGCIIACLQGNVWCASTSDRNNRVILSEGEALEIARDMQMSKPQALETLKLMFCGFPVMKELNPADIIFRSVVVHGK